MRVRTDYARRGVALSASSRGVGGVFSPGPSAASESWTETREYAARVNKAVRSLLKDAYAQIVYEDPKAAADTADEWGGPGAELEGQILTERASARGVQQTSKDLTWSARFREFRLDWEQHYSDVNSVSPGFALTAAWSRTQEHESRFRDLWAKYAQLGGTKPSAGLPPTFTTPDGKPADGSTIPWTGIIIVGGIIGLATFSQSLVKLVRG